LRSGRVGVRTGAVADRGSAATGPARALAATYRFQTKVRRKTTSPKLFRTFTLPRAVEFR
jgi:hypothetical protein